MGKEVHKTLPSLIRLPYNEFSNDMELQPSMDMAWHYWLQPKWDKERTAWIEKMKKEGK